MQPKDFAKKKFKTVPGADYSEGPISKYGTFGNMLRTRVLTGLKKSADNIPMNKDDVTGENIEQITDMFNPMAGMFVPAGKAVKNTFSDIVTKIPMKWIDDSKMRLREPMEIAGGLRAKYYPKKLEQSKFDHPVDWEEAVSDELSSLNRKRIDIEQNGPLSELADVNQKIAWVEDPKFEMDWAMQTDGRNSYRLDQIMDHPELFKEQPHLREIKVDYQLDGDSMGSFNSRTNTIGMNRNYEDSHMRKLTGRDAEAGTLLHEAQHSIQDNAGWPRGGNKEEFMTQYRNNRKRIMRVISNQEVKQMVGDPYDAELLERAQKAFDDMPSPFQQYQNLYGEQQARAVQEFLKAPTRKNYRTKRNDQQTPWSALKISEGKLHDPLIRYNRNRK